MPTLRFRPRPPPTTDDLAPPRQHFSQKSRDAPDFPPPRQRNPVHSDATPRNILPLFRSVEVLGGESSRRWRWAGGTGKPWSIGEQRATDSTGLDGEWCGGTREQGSNPVMIERPNNKAPVRRQSPTNWWHVRDCNRCHTPATFLQEEPIS